MTRNTLSSDSLEEATRERGRFSGHGAALGTAGASGGEDNTGPFLSTGGESTVVNPQEHGFGSIRIGASWDNVAPDGGRPGFWGRLIKRVTSRGGVDIDLGCLYELADGTRGAVQAFGNMYGKYKEAPFIALSGDETTGDKKGEDELIGINGAHWPQIKKVLIYAYIFRGVPNWAALRPRIRIRVPGEEVLTVVPGMRDSRLAVCVIAGLENVRNGIKITNYTEYFAGHAEMDRAFGHGLKWADGEKDGAAPGSEA